MENAQIGDFVAHLSARTVEASQNDCCDERYPEIPQPSKRAHLSSFPRAKSRVANSLCAASFMSAISLPRRVSDQTISWVCNVLDNRGFELTVLYLQRLACSSLPRTTPALLGSNLPKLESADAVNYGTADFGRSDATLSPSLIPTFGS